jgi:hypothetical protein
MSRLPDLNEEIRFLMLCATEKFGGERAEELRPEIQRLAEELVAVRSFELGHDDEP